jgi:hypothetical protein
MVRRRRISDRAHDSEREVSSKHLADFQSRGSLGEKFAERIAPGMVWDKKRLIVLGITCSNITSLQFPRDFTRTRELVYKWLTDNYSTIEPLAALLRLE